jgi:hypothetical protein
LLLAGLAALTALLVHASRSMALGAGDRATTGTFLTATLHLDETIIANTKTSITRAHNYAKSLEQTCPGVIASAPIRTTGETPSESKLDVRGSGELARHENQLFELRVQLADSLLAEVFGPDQEALLAYRRAVEPLRWSNPLVNSAVTYELASLRYFVEGPIGEVCTSLRAWSASDYQTVDAATRQAGQRFTALANEFFSYELAGTTTLEAMLERYESPSQRSLARRIESLTTTLSDTDNSSVGNGVGAALGFVEEPESAPQGIEIGHGLTAAGTSFVVRAEHVPLVGCHYMISVESKSATGLLPFAIGESTSSSSGSSSGCPARGRRAMPHVACEAKTVTVEYRTPAAARRARLELSDGRTYTSAVIAVPRRLGGPAGFYYQTVAGTKHRPVSLTLLNSHGAAIAVVRLPRASGCAPSPLPSARPTKLAVVTDPDGSSFEIRGEGSSVRHRHVLQLEAASQQTEGEPLLSVAAPTSGRTISGQLQWHLSSSCEPTDTLIYGLLKTPADHVLAKTTDGLVQLSTAAIPQRLHGSGQLVYGAVATMPTELVLQAPDGSTLATVNFAAQDREAAEYCAGYDEAAPVASG